MGTKFKIITSQIWEITELKIVQRIVMASLLFTGVAACSKDGTLKEPDKLNPLENPQGNLLGSLEEIENFYTIEFVDAMMEMDFNFNLGNTPPNLEGSFLISPFILEDSTVEADSVLIGAQFQDYLATFSNQDNGNLSIDLHGTQASQTDTGSGSFITGSNVSFTIYAKTISFQGTSSATTAVAISGTRSPNGIINTQFFGGMIDNNGNPQGLWIENNTGRLIIDGDGFSLQQNLGSKSKGHIDLLNWIKKLE